jgi:hypothetical protein
MYIERGNPLFFFIKIHKTKDRFMSHKIKCYCKLPFKGMGRSFSGTFYKSGNRLIDKGDGTQELRRADPICETTYVDKVTGVFLLDDIKVNREALRDGIISGLWELEDLELQEEIVGTAKVVRTTTIINEVRRDDVVQKAGTVAKTNVYGAGKFDADTAAKLQKKADLADAARARMALARSKIKPKTPGASPFLSSDTNKYLNEIKENIVAPVVPVIESEEEIDDETREFMELLEKEELENASKE